jgi:GNAT superfamily N-acetyltransferase
MYEGSNVVISAYAGDRLIGVLRGWTDFVYDGYVCDLAIHPDFQNAGVGRRMLELSQELGEGIQWILVASPLARDYYAHLGWKRVEEGWEWPRKGWNAPAYEIFQAEHADLAAKA